MALEASIADGVHLPSFYCPISQQCMHDPVVLADGHSYERRHIERWLQEHSTSPVTGLPLARQDMFPNHALRNAIEEYFQKILAVHRQAIRRAIGSPKAREQQGISSNAQKLVDAWVRCGLLDVDRDVDKEYIVRHIMEEAKTLVGAEAASVFLLDCEHRSLRSTINSTGGELNIPVTMGIAGHVAATGEPVIVHDAYSDSRFDRTIDAKVSFITRSILCVPLKVKQGSVLGVVQLINKTAGNTATAGTHENAGKNTFTAEDLQLLSAFASQTANAIVGGDNLHADLRRGLPRQQQHPCRPHHPLPPQEHCTSQSRGQRSSFSVAPKSSVGCLSQQRCMDSVEHQKVQKARVEPTFVGVQVFGGSSAPEVMASRHEGQQAVYEQAPHAISADSLLAQALQGWQWDPLALAAATNHRPLSTLATYLFEHVGLVEHFNLDRERLARFFGEIESGYIASNAYHNSTHAAAVMHAMHALLEHAGLAKAVAQAFDGVDPMLAKMACLLAAAVHDYEHLGLSNDFLVRTMDVRALCYNDQHVNENYHVAAAFDILRRPDHNFLQHLPPADFRRLRELVIKVVIGTDMGDHGRILKAFTDAMAAHAAAASKEGETPGPFVPVSQQDAALLLQVAMKCADLGHLTSVWQVHVQWVRRLEEEFFAQGDKEKTLGLLPVSFLMDREKPGASHTQVGFFDLVALPLFRALVRALPAAEPMLQGAVANYQRWSQPEAAAAAAAAAGKAAASPPGALASASDAAAGAEELHLPRLLPRRPGPLQVIQGSEPASGPAGGAGQPPVLLGEEPQAAPKALAPEP